MTIFDETFEVLPERLETSDYNASFILMAQRNRAVQIAFGSAGQAVLQSNSAGAVVTQINL